AFPFLRLPLHELTDGELDLRHLWNDPCLLEQVYEAGSIPARLAHLEAILLRRCPSAPDALLANALHVIRASRGGVSISELVSQVALSERQLERRFRDQTGLSPKLFTRLTRFRSAVLMLQRQPFSPLDDLAQ